MSVKSLYKIRRNKGKINYDYHVVVVTRTNKHLYVQLLEPNSKRTIFSLTSQSLEGTKSEKSLLLGKKLSEYLNTNKISKVVFDRNGNLFTGRIKLVADSLPITA
jgi:large subunit ribosomal protein L18